MNKAKLDEENDVDIEAIELYMSQFGAGDIHISKEYWNEGIAIININNPEKKNAISGKMMVDFRKCIEQLEKWDEGKAVIIQGCGENFCSGGDLDFARNCNTNNDGFKLSYLMQDVVIRLRKLPLISIALVHGPTVGGGAEIAIACDFILACDNVKLGFVHGKMGIITAWGATTRLCQVLGEKRALELLLSSQILNAENCLAYGLATKILNTDQRLTQCLEWTRYHTRHHHSVTRSFKLAASINNLKDFEQSVNNERKLFVPLWGGPANLEALGKNIKHVEK